MRGSAATFSCGGERGAIILSRLACRAFVTSSPDNRPQTTLEKPKPRKLILNVDAELRNILGEVLSLGSRADRFTAATELLGSLPELDSMAVVSVLTTIEERFGIVIGDDEISAQTFATFGSLRDFVQQKLEG